MLDPKLLRDNINQVVQNLQNKGYTLDISRYLELEKSRKDLQSCMESYQSQRNILAKEIGAAKSQGLPCADLFSQAQGLS